MRELTGLKLVDIFQPHPPLNSGQVNIHTHTTQQTTTSIMNSLFDYYQEYETLWSQQEWHQNLLIPYYKGPFTHLLPMTTVALYIAMVFLLPNFLSRINCKGTFLKPLMALWNLVLSVASLAMMLGFLPHFLEIMQQRGFISMVCDTRHDLFRHEKMRFWVNMFIISKFVELVDTLFLIVKNPSRPGK